MHFIIKSSKLYKKEIIMNRNILKSIACISMLIDHIGYLLFPNILIFRLIGRLAMPIFSFFIAEGCRHSSNRFRYFLRIFLLGLLCQTVYITQELLTSGKITPQSSCLYLNILLTFSLSIPICFSFLHFENMRKETQSKKYQVRSLALFLVLVGAVILTDLFCRQSQTLVGIKITIDYGLSGILLPLFAIIFKEKELQVSFFAFGLFLFCIALCQSTPYIWISLLLIPLLLFYNGKRGCTRLKYTFYLFYPAHLAALYGIHLLAA